MSTWQQWLITAWIVLAFGYFLRSLLATLS